MPTQLRIHPLALASSQMRFTVYPASARMHTSPLSDKIALPSRPTTSAHAYRYLGRYLSSRIQGIRSDDQTSGSGFSYWEDREDWKRLWVARLIWHSMLVGALPSQRATLPSASTEPSLDSGAYSSRSWRMTFCLRNTVSVSFLLQRCQARARRPNKRFTYS